LGKEMADRAVFMVRIVAGRALAGPLRRHVIGIVAGTGVLTPRIGGRAPTAGTEAAIGRRNAAADRVVVKPSRGRYSHQVDWQEPTNCG
jgi:hypothetical protein